MPALGPWVPWVRTKPVRPWGPSCEDGETWWIRMEKMWKHGGLMVKHDGLMVKHDGLMVKHGGLMVKHGEFEWKQLVI